MFDCPQCGLPSEIIGHALTFEGGVTKAFSVIQCLGEHGAIAAEDAWLKAYLGQ